MPNRLKFGFEFSEKPSARPRDPGQPMRVLVIGNFSGQASAASDADVAEKKIQRVDVDNFSDLMARVRPVIRVPLDESSAAAVEITVQELEDFHPDKLYDDLPVFQHLRELRKRLLDPQTFSQASAELREALPLTTVEPQSDRPDRRGEETESQTLDRLLGESATRPEEATKRSAQIDVADLIKKIVGPHVVPGPDPRQDDYIESVDRAVSAQMRAILHDEAFRTLEAVWRGLHFLITRVETSEDLQVFVLDLSATELRRAMESESARVEDSELFERLVVQREQEPWSALVSTESFGGSEQDVTLLGRLGAVAARAGAPLLAASASGLFGLESWPEAAGMIEPPEETQELWSSLRASPVSAWIGLAAPRFLLRLPYGAATDPVDAFAFEELDDPEVEHESFLWGSPAIVCATLIATAFANNGWAMTLGDDLEIDDLPAATFRVDGESQLKPCAEVNLTQAAGESILNRGVMPLMSFKHRNAVRLLRFQSIADPPAPLSGFRS